MGNIIIILQNTQWEKLGKLPAQDYKSVAQLAKSANIHIPIACRAGMCGLCKAKVIQGAELIQKDKITKAMKELDEDEKGNPKEIFTCIAGVKSKFFNDEKEYHIILQKDI